MYIQTIIWISCALVAVTSSSIDETATVGKFVSLGENVTIKDNANIGDFAAIGSSTSIGEKTNVGPFAKIRDHCSFENLVKIGKYARLNSYVSISNKSEIGAFTYVGRNTNFKEEVVVNKYVKIGDKCVFEDGVTIRYYARVDDECTLKDDVIADSYVTIGYNNTIKANSYLGKNSQTRSNVTVGESAIIHKNVHIPGDTVIQPNQVVIRTPSSFDLYWMSDPDIDESASPEFNKKLDELMNVELNALTAGCSKPDTATNPKSLPKIISVYLIQYHGLYNFKSNVRMVQDNCDNGWINWHRCQSMRETLQREHHFGKQAQRNILEASVTDKFVQLLATAQDAMREIRAQNDTFCTVLKQMRNAERKAICV